MFFKWISKTCRAYKVLIMLILTITLASLIVMVGISVLARLLPSVFPTIPDEIISLVLIWNVCLATAVLGKQNDHLRMEWIEAIMTRHQIRRRLYFSIRGLLELTAISFFVYSSIKLWIAGQRMRTPTLLLPQHWWYLALVVGGFLLAIGTALYVGQKLSEKRRPNGNHKSVGN